MSKVILWDFDGTLAYRRGMWSGCVMEILDETEPGHQVRLESLKAGLHDGFPWHRPDDPHPHLCDPARWWEPVEAIIARALQPAGFSKHRSRELAALVRARYIDATKVWRVYDDVPPTLRRLTNHGWRHMILSNHVPELQDIVAELGLSDHVDDVISSARTGYEKPHPEAFRGALRRAGRPKHAWMVGDSYTADIQGATAIGLQAVLVRSEKPEAPHRAPDLQHAAEIILANSPQAEPRTAR